MNPGWLWAGLQLAILAGVNKNPYHSTEIILSILYYTLISPAGPHAFSRGVLPAGFQPYISPYASSYYLRAALASNANEATLELLNNLCDPMAAPSHGNKWEPSGRRWTPKEDRVWVSPRAGPTAGRPAPQPS